MSKLELERHWIEYGRNENRVYTNCNNEHKITFIIPTIGRHTIIKTIRSLFEQTNNNWKCIIVCDGILFNKEIQNTINSDSRISVITIQKTGVQNKAGTVRNKGIELVKTDWVGFVDDDDVLSPLYVDTFINNIQEDNTLKCIIFRMMYSDSGIFPDKDSTNFVKQRVGISFCYSMSLFRKGLQFFADNMEDFNLLHKIRSGGHKILMSNKICYFVRPIKIIDLNFVNALKTIEKDIIKSIIN
jgi:glycosyltransferase involved in cell wall biosynthesis